VSQVQQFATFFLAGNYIGIEVERVQEILSSQQMTPVPLAPPEVSGLLNLHGQIVTAIDLRRRLGLAERLGGEPPMNIVVCTTGGAVCLQVDDIGDVVETGESTFELPPDTLNGPARNMIRGVHKLQGQLLHVLDADEVLNAASMNQW
jgi:purine-binding chemotaxis protein CheW